MRDLRFVGLDDSGSRLLFTLDDDDEQFAAEVDADLIDATRRAYGWRGRTRTTGDGEGQADRHVNPTTDELRPREIQARVRAGESPAEVATSAGIELERVERFARPVLQEREYVAGAAQQVVVRTGALDGPLGEVVADRLAGVVTDPAAQWDAWRREDGRWTVALTFRDDVQERHARWSFDPSTNSVIVDDETARWLTEGTPAPAPTPRVSEPRAPRSRRLLSVPDLEPEPAPAAELAPVADLVAPEDAGPAAHADEAPVVLTTPATETGADEQTAFDLPLAPSSAPSSAPAARPEPAAPAAEAAPAAPAAPAAESGAEPAAADKPARKRKAAKRASVPSWDDIVFGARKPTD